MEGKARSSRNATKHGVTSSAPVIPGELLEDWNRHRDGFVAELLPERTGPVGVFLAERAASLAWRLRRLERYETTTLTAALEQADTAFADDRRLSLHAAAPDDRSLRWFTEARTFSEELAQKVARHEAHLARQLTATLRSIR